MGTWLNSDGLYIKLGITEAQQGKAGEYKTMDAGAQHVTEMTVTLTDATASTAIYEDNVMLPAGAFLEKVEVVAEVAGTSGGGATLDVGLVRTDRTTVTDATGILAAFTLANTTPAGKTTTLTVGSSTVGTSIGTVLANDALLSIRFGTAAFTAGKVKVKIYWGVQT